MLLTTMVYKALRDEMESYFSPVLLTQGKTLSLLDFDLRKEKGKYKKFKILRYE